MVAPNTAWIVPVLIPLVLGVVVGFIIRRTVKLSISIIALAVILVITGYVSLTFGDLFEKAMEFLPTIIDLGKGLSVLPYASMTFILGLALGLWKG